MIQLLFVISVSTILLKKDPVSSSIPFCLPLAPSLCVSWCLIPHPGALLHPSPPPIPFRFTLFQFLLLATRCPMQTPSPLLSFSCVLESFLPAHPHASLYIPLFFLSFWPLLSSFSSLVFFSSISMPSLPHPQWNPQRQQIHLKPFNPQEWIRRVKVGSALRLLVDFFCYRTSGYTLRN